MQKKLIALAIAGLAAAPAFAQSNVTIYGVADVYYGYGKTDDGNKFSGINSGGLNGSRLGFKGTEDLGNGLKAMFVYELGTLALDTGTGQAGTRQSYVGLGGNWGTVVAGRLQSPGYDFGVKYDAFGAAVFSPVGQLTDNGMGYAGVNMTVSGRDSNARLNNAAAYISPSFGGVTLKAAYAFGEQIKSKEEGLGVSKVQNIWALAADYDNGPLSVGAIYHDLNHLGGTDFDARNADQTEWGLGASYDFTVVKLVGSYQQAKAKFSGGGLDSASIKGKLWNIGVAVPVGPGTIKVAYADYRENRSDAGCANGNGDGAKCRANSWGVDYEYGLSKRTTAYVGYSQIRNKNFNNYVLTNISSADAWSTTGDSSKPKSQQFGFGVRHVF